MPILKKTWQLGTHFLCLFALTIFLLCGSAASGAQEKQSLSDERKAEMRQHFITVEQMLSNTTVIAEQLEDLITQSDSYRSASENCARYFKKKLAAKRKEIAALVGAPADEIIDKDKDAEAESAGPAANTPLLPELEELEKDQASYEKRMVECHVLAQKAEQHTEQLTDRYNNLVISSLRTRDTNVLQVFRQLWAEHRSVLSTLQSGLRSVFSGSFWSFRHNGAAALIFIVGLLMAVLVRHKLPATLPARADEDISFRFRPAALLTLRRHAILLLPLVMVALFIFITGPTIRNLPLPVVLCYSLAGLATALYTTQLLLRPPAPAQPFLPIRPTLAVAVRRRLNVLAVLVFTGLFLYLFFLPLPIPAVLAKAAHVTAITLLTTNLVWLFWLVNRTEKAQSGGKGLRLVMMSILTIALLAEYLGYHNFAEFLLVGFLGTLLAIFLLWLFSQLTQEVFDGLDAGTRLWHRNVRKRLAIADGAHIPGLIWLRLLATLGVWALAALVFLNSWSLASAAGVWFKRYVVEGFQIGETNLVPINLLLGLAVFAVILMLSGQIKKQLGERSTLLARYDPAARQTVVTLTGYIGIIIAVLLGMSFAGFGFGNLAIIAGALSVGIGFGMQNIVNNFVSGIIILFERPIRKGDWVIVGDTEGEVININVRATQVLTLDRYDIVIPNSEFISSQVTNCSLVDAYVRLVVPVGVAYGSDTELVKNLLEQAAREHPEVVKNYPGQKISDPVIQFRSFGDSSLDFVVRCFIRQARRKPFVTSDLNFRIDALFREHNIEIPFPQRDLHIRSSDIDLK